MKINTALQMKILQPRELIGKTLKRGDLILTVKSVSILQSGFTYVHPGNPETFGWTFLNPNGTLCGEWEVIDE